MDKEAVIIDREKCIGCGSCVRDCFAGHIQLRDGKAFVNDGYCIRCGHCFAVCPTEAVSMEGYDCESCRDYLDPAELDADRLLLAMKSRRTVRRFTTEPVSPEDMAKIIEAGRCCPTAKNMQNVHFIILDSVKEQAEKLAISTLLETEFSSGSRTSLPEDFLFKNAPLVIVCADSRADNAGLASSYMELVANALGLGVLYSGYFVRAANNCPQLYRLMGIPEGLKVVTCLVIGHPDVKYLRTAPRREANVIIR